MVVFHSAAIYLAVATMGPSQAFKLQPQFQSTVAFSRSRDVMRIARAAKESTTTFDRQTIDSIFNSERSYLFETRKNVRSYQWGMEQAEDLFESIAGLLDDEDEELDLSIIFIMERAKTFDEKKDLGKTSVIYDVHDGQQRLVSLSLLVAALRDNYVKWSAEVEEFDPDNEATAEIQAMIRPDKTRKKTVTRVRVPNRQGIWLHKILNGTVKVPHPRERKELGAVDNSVLEVFDFFKAQIERLGPEKTETFLERLKSNVYISICVPPDTRTARSIVMSQGKGLDLEPVDEFKGIVCFSNIRQEELQDKIQVEWESCEVEMGRDIVEQACLLLAQREVCKPLKKSAVFKVDYFDDFLKNYLYEHECDGAHFFKTEILEAAKLLKEFRDGAFHLVGDATNPPSLKFLLDVSQLPTCKELEIAVFSILLEHRRSSDKTKQADLEYILGKLERIAVWMMLAKPPPKARSKRVIDIIKGLPSAHIDGDSLKLEADEKCTIRSEIEQSDFGSTSAGVKVAKAILLRLNEHIQVKEHQGRWEYLPKSLQLEHVLPQKLGLSWREEWSEDEAKLWMHRLGNLALLNQKVNSEISNGPFPNKKDKLSESPYPLTKAISKMETWDSENVVRNHKNVVATAVQVWNL